MLTKLSAGVTFKSKHLKNTRIEVLNIDILNNILKVKINKKLESHLSDWNEEWNLQHTLWVFEDGTYELENNFEGFPPTYYSKIAH